MLFEVPVLHDGVRGNIDLSGYSYHMVPAIIAFLFVGIFDLSGVIHALSCMAKILDEYGHAPGRSDHPRFHVFPNSLSLSNPFRHSDQPSQTAADPLPIPPSSSQSVGLLELVGGYSGGGHGGLLAGHHPHRIRHWHP